jgi:hypothetical protein
MRLAFWLSGFLAFWLSGFLAFWLSGFLAFWLGKVNPTLMVYGQCHYTPL